MLVSAEFVVCDGPRRGQRIAMPGVRLTIGRDPGSGLIAAGATASRLHAEVLWEESGYVLYDRTSRNGTLVNGVLATCHRLRHGDRITIGEETYRFATAEAVTPLGAPAASATQTAVVAREPALRVVITGGGPVGLSLALLLDDLMGSRVAVTMYDERWMQAGSDVVWKDERHGNVRRQQVVTIQSRQYLLLPAAVQARLFGPGCYTEMWPVGPDSIRGQAPRNVRIAHFEDVLLDLANEKADRIRLVPTAFDPAEQHETVANSHVLAICEGSRSPTRDRYSDRFGVPDGSAYSLAGEHLQDVVLGLRVRSDLPDPMIVALTVAQNRFLLNSLRGEGFLNMRLTDAEAAEVIGIDPVRREFRDCIASRPCTMVRDEHDDFRCSTHHTLFLPALVKGSGLWRRIMDGLALFGVAEEHLTAVTAFRLDMVQRSRFSAQLYAATPTTPGTYGFLLGDAANAIHFWPGRGLNSGLVSAVSLARTVDEAWHRGSLRDADFVRHEAAMAMLQYRHKSRAWRAMVATEADGSQWAIKDKIAQGIDEGRAGLLDRDADIEALLERLRTIRTRLASRLPGLPDDTVLRNHLQRLSGETLRTLQLSGPWDTAVVGGEEVDIDLFSRQPVAAAALAA
ncbi:FHA domain-containing protein [Virgisporangium aurantiacum]|uniref:FHA domain-containing protein n=1 Tax=Virgisporangium aurantiacum TaxID=175570 RepID=A0A8J3ZIZ3_9ACTN|nr:FHA domain-containing protein [Virgisporangium aurantiacum]GIJ64666.1 hypothetical protein Vau01_121820 [Virgisporangium aurantiacum]